MSVNYIKTDKPPFSNARGSINIDINHRLLFAINPTEIEEKRLGFVSFPYSASEIVFTPTAALIIDEKLSIGGFAFHIMQIIAFKPEARSRNKYKNNEGDIALEDLLPKTLSIYSHPKNINMVCFSFLDNNGQEWHFACSTRLAISDDGNQFRELVVWSSREIGGRGVLVTQSLANIFGGRIF